MVNKIARALPAENIVSVTSFSPNDKLNSSVRKAIHKSSVCFLVLSNHISQSQKIKMRELRDQNKKVYVITTPDSVNIPQSYRELVPISSNDEEFEKKLDEIIMSSK